ncbi:MFS transporter [Glutamicibacter sp. MNS18]|uniref:MFS transporter n=1 Tax=Glutamicibacter sp. MNS18 TaxID=2989817 RepID=UPI002236B0C1|nr:MFS transporter [Glutamicibacter sp. MNS18]MCW4467089.1 MFS transporter [Glutamicibacter sp. MNS18]
MENLTVQTQPRPLSTRRRWAALAVLLFPVLLVSVDNTVLSFAVPAISAALQPTGNQLLWIIDIYPLVLAGLLVPMGSLGDRIGRRKLLLTGAVGFALVSGVAAFATDASQLIAARVLLGFFGAMLMPATLSLLRNIFEDPTERRTAIAIWAAAFSGGAVLGPIIGGILLEHFWWGSVFFLAVPMLLPLLIGGLILLPESKDPNPGKVDPISILLVIMTLLPFVYGIKSISSGPWFIPVIALVLSVVCGVVFVRRQLGQPTPMLDVRLFTNRIFSGALVINLIGVFSLVGFIYFVSQHLQLISGLTPFEAGVWMTPGLVLTMVFGLLAVRFAKRFGASNVMIAGLVLSALAYGIVVFAGSTGNDNWLLVAFCILGLGVGMSETLSNDLVISEVPAAKAGAASAISETAYEIGSVLGTAVLGTILNGIYAVTLQVPSSLSPAQAEAATQTLSGAHTVAGELDGTTSVTLLEAAAHSFDQGVLVTASLAALLALVAAIVVFRVVKPVAR